MLDKLTLEQFKKVENQRFTIHLGDGTTVETELIEVKDMTIEGAAKPERAPFSLIFRGPKEPVLVQQIMELENPTLGKLSLFLVPLGPDDHGVRYEAVFN